jgi:hypothetical protein
MLDQLTGPLVLICGQNIVEAAVAPKDKELVSHINSHNPTCSHVMIGSDGCSA